MLIISVIIYGWIGFVLHNYVSDMDITPKILNTARIKPQDSVLANVKGFFPDRTMSNERLIEIAEHFIRGDNPFGNQSSMKAVYPFDKSSYEQGSPKEQLELASLKVPSYLIDAYEGSDREEFLIAAKEIINAFSIYESGLYIPKGMIWNDHAIAARIAVLAKFWNYYRQNAKYDQHVAKNIIQLIDRSRKLLSKKAHFNYSSNHGIMQNLALMQICAWFPSLPDNDYYKRLALQRLKEQMQYYINQEGVVLEHSASYQKAGIDFLSKAIEYLSFLQIPIPEDFRIKLKKAEKYYRKLLRPDGSLPIFGDTKNAKYAKETNFNQLNNYRCNDVFKNSEQINSDQMFEIFPVAGYAIMENDLCGDLNSKNSSQTVILWSYYKGHAHKHADEMSVVLWSGGQEWWTNTGYWPYGAPNRPQAISWAGSNAPHLLGEKTDSIRKTKLVSYGKSEVAKFIELNRNGPDEYVANRQILFLEPSIWMVIDHVTGNKNDYTTTTWTTSPEINMIEGQKPGTFILSSEDGKLRLNKYLIGSHGIRVSQIKGNLSPFAGWVGNRPAPSIVTVQPADDSWVAAIWLMDEKTNESVASDSLPDMINHHSNRNWRIRVPAHGNIWEISRVGDEINITNAKDSTLNICRLTNSNDVEIEKKINKLDDKFKKVSIKYFEKKYSFKRLLKTTYLILFFIFIQETFFFIYKKIRWKYYFQLRIISYPCWAVLFILLFNVL